MELEQKIEAILFYKGEPVSLKDLVSMLKTSKEEVTSAIQNLKNSLSNRGIVLQENDESYLLGTTPEVSELIENIRKEELNKNLSKAALETLSIILYKNGAHRAYIDYIRGVNSNFTVRMLSARGLIYKEEDKTDKRRFVYKPTFELLSFMGVSRVEDLPNYQETLAKLDASYQSVAEETQQEESDAQIS